MLYEFFDVRADVRLPPFNVAEVVSGAAVSAIPPPSEGNDGVSVHPKSPHRHHHHQTLPARREKERLQWTPL